MQEQMISVNDSGDFQDVESNKSGRLSHVSSQFAMIPSSRSLLSRDKRLSFDTWNTSGLQENVFGNLFSTFDSYRNHWFPCMLVQGLLSQEMEIELRAQFQCRHLQEGLRP